MYSQELSKAEGEVAGHSIPQADAKDATAAVIKADPALTKGYFVEQTDDLILLARTSSAVAPMVLEELRQAPKGNAEALAEAMHAIQPKASPSGYMNACCAVYPPRQNCPAANAIRPAPGS